MFQEIMPYINTSVRVVLTFFTALTVVLSLMGHFANLASRIGLMDQPNGRKIHQRPVPLIGGLVMAIGVMSAGLLFFPLKDLRGYFAGSILLVLVGFLDDFRELGHRSKFFAQILAAILMIVFSNVLLRNLGDLLGTGTIATGTLALPLTIFAIVGVCNTINMLDGLDGLAGIISLIVFLAFAYLGYVGKTLHYSLLATALCGALLGFLRFNWHPARVFMGDAGSLFLGYSLAFLSVILTQGPGAAIRPITPLILLAVPITDTLVIMVHRILQRKNPFLPDKTHLHHILLRMGFSKKRAVCTIAGITLFFAILAVAAELFAIPERHLFFVFIAYFLLIFLLSCNIPRLIKNVKKNRPSGLMRAPFKKNL